MLLIFQQRAIDLGDETVKMTGNSKKKNTEVKLRFATLPIQNQKAAKLKKKMKISRKKKQIYQNIKTNQASFETKTCQDNSTWYLHRKKKFQAVTKPKRL